MLRPRPAEVDLEVLLLKTELQRGDESTGKIPTSSRNRGWSRGREDTA